jgi:trans-aconitate methyltransferase
MEAMLTPVDEPLIRALNLDAPCRIADIGCGGGTTLEILRPRRREVSFTASISLRP